MKKTVLSKHQLTFLVLMCASGLSVGMSPNDLVVMAQQDLWIVVAISVPINIVICLYYYHTANRMAGQELPVFIDSTFGKHLGRIINFLYFVFFIITTALTNRVMGNLIQIELIPTTPMWAILTPFIFVAFYGVYKGLSAIARTSEILVPVMIVMFTFTIAMLLKKAHIDNYLPVLEYGVKPLLPSLLTFVSYTGFSLIALLTFYPNNVAEIKGTKVNLILGILFSCGMNLLVAGFSVLIVGPKIASLYYYPGYLLAREVVVGNIMERSDAFIVILWFYAVFVNSVIYSYASFRVGCNIFKPKNRLTFVLLLAVLVSYLSQIDAFNVLNLHKLFKEYWFAISIVFALLFPTISLILDKFKRKELKQNDKN